MFLESLVDIDHELLYVIDDKICEFVHMYNDEQNNVIIDIVLYDEYIKYFNIHNIYETIILEYHENIRKNICSIEKSNIVKIYKSSTYDYIENDIYDEQIDIEDINALLIMDENEKDNLSIGLTENYKFPILTLKFKNIKQLAKFKILS